MSAGAKKMSATSHLWALDSIVAELQMCPAPSSHEMEQLMDARKVEILSYHDGAATQKFKDAYDTPNANLRLAPVLKRPDSGAQLHPRSLKKLLKQDRALKSDKIQFYPPLDGVFATGPAARRVVEHTDDEDYTEIASTLSFHSPLVDRYLKTVEAANATGPDTLYAPMGSTTSIMPCGSLLPLEASPLASTTSISLLTGARVYVVYPPTTHNMASLDKYFQVLALGNSSRSNHTKACQALQGGVAFSQRPGETVTIPPHCPTVVFATKTSAAVSTRWRGKEGLPMRVIHVGDLTHQIMAVQHVREEELATALEYHLVQLYKSLSIVLRAPDLRTPDHDLPLTIGAAWKDAGPRYLDLVERHTSKSSMGHILKNIPKLWNFVVQSHSLEACPICHMAFDKHRQIGPSSGVQDMNEEGKVRLEVLRTCDRINDTFSRMERILEMDVEEKSASLEPSVIYLEHFRKEHLQGEEVTFKLRVDRITALLKDRLKRVVDKVLEDLGFSVDWLDASANSLSEEADACSEIASSFFERLELLHHWERQLCGIERWLKRKLIERIAAEGEEVGAGPRKRANDSTNEDVTELGEQLKKKARIEPNDAASDNFHTRYASEEG
jgi:hypothetical protein